MTRIAVFGDVHGHLPVLEVLFDRVNSKYKPDQWYSCGDLCDRGPDTPGVVQFCIDNKIEAVLGNHDEWLLSAIRNGFNDHMLTSTWLYPSNGGRETVTQYGGNIVIGGNAWGGLTYGVHDFKVPSSHEEYLFTRPTVIETEYGYVLHGGIGPQHVKQAANQIRMKLRNQGQIIDRPEAMKLVTPFDCEEDTIRWFNPGRNAAYKAVHYWHFDKPQIVGHIGVDKPVISDNHIALDTGCSWDDGALTAIILPERKFVTVTKEEIYGNPTA